MEVVAGGHTGQVNKHLSFPSFMSVGRLEEREQSRFHIKREWKFREKSEKRLDCV